VCGRRIHRRDHFAISWKHHATGALVGAAVVAVLKFVSGLLSGKGLLLAAIEGLALGIVLLVGAYVANAFLQEQMARRKPR
jgi:Mg/Co/Ni transporter MgtE